MLFSSMKGALIILGDFNARVGKDGSSWPNVTWKHFVGNTNSNGLMLLELCTRFQLSFLGAVPTDRQLKEHMATSAFNALPSA